ncbi:hypothetical protein CLV40_103473 [Actinokineospora auranticolor]|uniref:Uncharacterized protein n=1 Tax=Actinokineospora auranticolor TaxID=155976 RepID=A0A2S6GXC9_9PSEU|nr:hypothetical protein CLV40_103473 [Actinokineospora auranticolor]
MERALHIFEATYAPDHPLIVTQQGNLESVQRDLDALDDKRR